MKYLARLAAASAAPAFLVLATNHGAAHPYIDAGTGSIIIQAVIGGLAGGLLVLKIFWGRITSFFRRLLSGSAKDGETSE